MVKRVLFCLRMPHHGSYAGGVVSIVQSYLDNNNKFLENGIQTSVFNCQIRKIKNSKIDSIAYWIKQRKTLGKVLRKEEYDILNIHTSREFLFMKDIKLAKFVAKRYRVQTVVTVHVGTVETVFRRIEFFKHILVADINTYVNKMIFLSEEMKKQFINIGVKPEICEVLYNFHNLIPVVETQSLSDLSDLHLLYVGAIHREKGIIELLKALNELSEYDFRLDICGKLTDPSIESEFKRLTNCLGNKVKIHGYVSGRSKTELFERADILILPSYHEGLPLVVLEALASGTAIISTPVGATPEILDEKSVLWVEIKSIVDIKNAVIKLLLDQKLLSSMKQYNRMVSKQYSLDVHIKKLCAIYNDLNG